MKAVTISNIYSLKSNDTVRRTMILMKGGFLFTVPLRLVLFLFTTLYNTVNILNLSSLIPFLMFHSSFTIRCIVKIPLI